MWVSEKGDVGGVTLLGSTLLEHLSCYPELDAVEHRPSWEGVILWHTAKSKSEQR